MVVKGEIEDTMVEGEEDRYWPIDRGGKRTGVKENEGGEENSIGSRV